VIGVVLLALLYEFSIGGGVSLVNTGKVLIFAELGRESGILSNEVYAGMVIVIAVTILLPPFIIEWYYRCYGARML
jgi:hypothetical protein